MNQIFESTQKNPYANIALEKQLAKKVKTDVILFLWQNDNTVVIGQNQNPYQECNLDYMQKHNILLARRYSGGGAVYHDLGNLNYTLMIKEKSFDMGKVKQFLCEMTNSLNIKCEFTGKNDLTICGAKFSGHAYYLENEVQVFHGTIMVNLKLEQLGEILTPSIQKLQSKGIQSVKSRVTNLQQINPNITIEKVKDVFCSAFEKVYGKANKKIFLSMSDVNQKEFENLQSRAWLYEQTPSFSTVLEKRYPFGMVSLNMDIVNNYVFTIRIYSDSLKTDWSNIEKELQGTPFDPEKLWNLFETQIKNAE